MKSRYRRNAAAAATALALGAALALPAHAHTSYLLPNLFAANAQDFVTLESAFTESPFQPEIAVDGGDFHIIGPDGTRMEFEKVTRARQLVLLEAPMKAEGTYRFTSGVRLGRIGKSALVDGKWVPVHNAAPAGATQVRTSQTVTVADAYVTRKAPTRAPVDAVVGALAIQPVTHPADVYLGGVFVVKVQFDGKPLASQTLVLERAGAQYEETKFHHELTTGPDGTASLSFDRAGVYLLMTRHRADAPAGAETDERSYTTSLTFEVPR